MRHLTITAPAPTGFKTFHCLQAELTLLNLTRKALEDLDLQPFFTSPPDVPDCTPTDLLSLWRSNFVTLDRDGLL